MSATIRAHVRDRILADAPDVLAVEGSRWERRVRVREAVAAVLAAEDLAIPTSDVADLVREIADDITGLGPLEPLLADPAVTEVMVNGARAVFVERGGRIEPVGTLFDTDADVLHVIDRIVGPLGLRVDESTPWVDARLGDGSRVHAIVQPLSVGGPAITIRRSPAVAFSLQDLAARGSIRAEHVALLEDAVRERRNIIVSGGTGAGKTTLLRALAALVDPAERVITIEDAAELRLDRAHVVALEARPANVEGNGRVSIRDLVRNALRMRPDRLIVGEVRGPEVLDMLQAMNTGHHGSMSSAHANSAGDLLSRIEGMALMAGEVPLDAIRRQMESALDVIVHVERRPDGTRRVEQICVVDPGLVLTEGRSE